MDWPDEASTREKEKPPPSKQPPFKDFRKPWRRPLSHITELEASAGKRALKLGQTKRTNGII